MIRTEIDQWLDDHAEDYLTYTVTDVDQALCDALRDAQTRTLPSPHEIAS